LTDVYYLSKPAVRIPYLAEDGTETAVRFRVGLEGTSRFRRKSGSKPRLYGLWRLDLARKAGYGVLVEGESDAQTLWLHEIPALGIPGASSWREAWASHLDDIPVIFVVVEPDQGGEAVRRWIATSAIRDRVRLLTISKLSQPKTLDQQPDRAQTSLQPGVARSAES
jgi:hypothetical protein